MNNANNIMKQLPREQRPYEKCFMQGEGSLNDTELLAVILRSGTSGKNSLALAQVILVTITVTSSSAEQWMYFRNILTKVSW